MPASCNLSRELEKLLVIMLLCTILIQPMAFAEPHAQGCIAFLREHRRCSQTVSFREIPACDTLLKVHVLAVEYPGYGV